MTSTKKTSKYVYRGGCAVLLTVLAVLVFAMTWYDYIQGKADTSKSFLRGMGNFGMSLIIYTLLYFFVGKNLHAFKIGVERVANVLASQILTLFVIDVAEVLVSLAIIGNFRFFWDFFIIYFFMFLIQSAVIFLATLMMIKIYRGIYPPLSVIMVYGDHENNIYDKMNGLNFKYRIDETISVHEGLKAIESRMGKYDAVLINDVPDKAENKLLKLCFDMDKRAYLIPKISDIIVKSSEELNLLDTPLFLCRNVGITWHQAVIKRLVDIILSLLALIITSPVMLITAIAIKANDKGPVFFRQERLTINDRKFMIIKFRSMIVDAEKDGKPRPAGQDDDRITKVGRFIRATRIDELPQLVNILKGDMSIVGPRPERVENVEMYTKEIPEFALRAKVKGGLTGYAQVYGKYNTAPIDKLKLDLCYIMNYSFVMDLQIVFETVKILFQKQSTEGFSEDRIEQLIDSKANKE